MNIFVWHIVRSHDYRLCARCVNCNCNRRESTHINTPVLICSVIIRMQSAATTHAGLHVCARTHARTSGHKSIAGQATARWLNTKKKRHTAHQRTTTTTTTTSHRRDHRTLLTDRSKCALTLGTNAVSGHHHSPVGTYTHTYVSCCARIIINCHFSSLSEIKHSHLLYIIVTAAYFLSSCARFFVVNNTFIWKKRRRNEQQQIWYPCPCSQVQ